MFLKEKKKIKVAVLYGGRSGEHEVSQRSAASIIKYLDSSQFDIIPVAIDKTGRWLKNDLKQLIFDDRVPVLTEMSQVFAMPDVLREQDNRFFDVIFPVLHGSFGEDGTIQGLCETLGIPYVGSGVLGSAVGMDKDVSKRLAQAAAIPVVPFVSFNAGQWRTNQAAYERSIQEQIQYPLFVKPANTGSSLGISKVHTAVDLVEAVTLAFDYDVKILVECALPVREIEVAVLENLQYGDSPLVSVAGEVIPSHEFYSYQAKYLDKKGAELLIPAPLRQDQADQIHYFSAKIFSHLECQGMARIDFFIDKTTQKIYFNELNTIPGFTTISMYPKLWEASGLAYQALLTHLVLLALQRHQRVVKLKHSL